MSVTDETQDGTVITQSPSSGKAKPGSTVDDRRRQLHAADGDDADHGGTTTGGQTTTTTQATP